MNNFGMLSVEATTYVDTSLTTKEVLLTHIDSEDLESTVVRFTAGNAAKLAHKLLAAAQQIQEQIDRESA